MDYRRPNSQSSTNKPRGNRGGRRGGHHHGNHHSRYQKKERSSSAEHHQTKLELTPEQKEMRRQCNIMSEIINPKERSIRFKYKSNNDKTVDLTQEMAFCINGTRYGKYFLDPGLKKSKEQCNIIVTKDTALKTARFLHSKGMDDICIMCFASPDKPGGNFDRGQINQETCLLSQTLLFGSIRSRVAKPFYNQNSKKDSHFHKPTRRSTPKGSDDDKDSSDDSSQSSKNGKQSQGHRGHQGHRRFGNPLFNDNGLIYSPKVPVIADGEVNAQQLPNSTSFKEKRNETNLVLLDKKDVFYVDIISVSAVNKSKILHSSKRTDKDKLERKIDELMETKIRNTVFNAASARSSYLILGAFGCGKFLGNDPSDISKIFRKVLIKDKYANYFSKIYFCIGCTGPVYDAFFREFEEYTINEEDDDNSNNNESDDGNNKSDYFIDQPSYSDNYSDNDRSDSDNDYDS